MLAIIDHLLYLGILISTSSAYSVISLLNRESNRRICGMIHLMQAIFHPYVACAALSIAFVAKAVITIALIRYIFAAPEHRTPLILLLFFLIGTIMGDLTYFGSVFLRVIMSLKGEIPLFTLFCRFRWIVFITSHQALILFFDYLITKNIRWTPFHVLNLLFNCIITACFLYLAIGCYGVSSDSSKTLFFERSLIISSSIYLIFVYAVLIGTIIHKLRSHALPQILTTQIKYLLRFLVPFSLFQIGDGLFSYYKVSRIPVSFSEFSWALGALTSALLLYYISKKVIGLRFLNLKKEIISHAPFHFLAQFNDILENVRCATSFQELNHLTQTFFHTAYGIKHNATHLILREHTQSTHAQKIESILSTDNTLIKIFKTKKIVLADDIQFSHFYNNTTINRALLTFLDELNADIFVPLFEQSSLVAYIIVERNARPKTLYTNKERDEILVFTTYISNIIAILKNSSIKKLAQEKKELSEELYHKHQEINQYRELVQSCLHTEKQRKIGIIHYKNRKFISANEAADELIGHDLNRLLGHPLTKTCTSIAQRCLQYRTTQTTQANDQHGNTIVITSIPSTDQKACMLVIHHPELSDLVKTQIDQLKDPSHRDYVLYLETTEAGRAINQLIPGRSESLLSFKIQLLSASLSKKALLLDATPDDLTATVELIHTLSKRETLIPLILTCKEQNDEVALQLFGINPLMKKDATESLLEKLDDTGTIFIQNIELLSLTTQQALAQFLNLGYFHPLKSTTKHISATRIICSSTKNLKLLTQEGAFCQELYNQLHTMTVSMPTPINLKEDAITDLANGYAEQLMTETTFKDLLMLTDKDTKQLLADPPLSLYEFKERIHTLLVEKSYKQNLDTMTTFDPAYNIADPIIAQAVRLGKKALKDPQIMAHLWQTFKSQTKIAQLLGVNRSSVHRRCQDYNLHKQK